MQLPDQCTSSVAVYYVSIGHQRRRKQSRLRTTGKRPQPVIIAAPEKNLTADKNVKIAALCDYSWRQLLSPASIVDHTGH
jgi:hypothetical protein